MDAKKLAMAFRDYESPWRLYSSTYKYTECGPTVGMLYRKNNRSKWTHIYCSDLPDKWAGEIAEIYVSSIVEGVDSCTETHIVKCKGSLKKIAEAYWSAVAAVNDEANEIWNETHGCSGCEKLFSRQGFNLNALEYTPVHLECKKCGGRGISI